MTRVALGWTGLGETRLVVALLIHTVLLSVAAPERLSDAGRRLTAGGPVLKGQAASGLCHESFSA